MESGTGDIRSHTKPSTAAVVAPLTGQMLREPGIPEIPAEMERSLENICELCSQFDFDSLGLKPWNFSLPHSAIERCYTPTILEMKGRAGTCVICKEVLGFYKQWITQNKALLDPSRYRMNDCADFCIDEIEFSPTQDELHKVVRMFVYLVIKNSPGECESYWPLFQFHKWTPQSREGNGKSAVEKPYNGRERGVLVNQTQLLDWKKVCDKNHGNSCKSNSNIMDHLDFIRLIDVQQRCVTVKKGGELANLEYAALSYVWGDKNALGRCKMPKLMRRGVNREAALRQRRALTPKKVLRTIDDAMTFVGKGLKLKYLWVDCLCILQAGDDNNGDKDTEADQKKFINAMDSIYACASVTIVAAAGDNANAGLPGINSRYEGECMKQNPLLIHKRDKPMVSIVRTLDLEGSGEILLSNYKYLGGSTWNTRGWTFQEKIFSRRTFIFTKMQVYWECQAATWCEDSMWETTEPSFYRHCFNAAEFRLPWNTIDVDKFSDKYRKLVEEYSERKLTRESDGLDAFTGILNALGRGTGVPKLEFKWGLPLSFLANALKWRCPDPFPVTKSCERRTEKHRISNARSCPFPSWSWVGWVGKVQMSILGVLMLDLHFYYHDDIAKKLVEVECRTRDLDGMIQQIRKDDDEIDVHIEDKKVEKALRKSVASNILFFWSSATRFQIRVLRTVGHVVCRRELAMGDPIKLIIQRPWHVPLLPPESTHVEYELVVIGTAENRTTPFKGDEDETELAVLVCSENKSEGVVYRMGLVEIPLREWKRCEPEWKLICLG